MERDKLLALLRELPPAPPPTAAELAELSASVAKAAEWAQQIKLPEFKPPQLPASLIAMSRPRDPVPGIDYMPPAMCGDLSNLERSPLRVELVEPVGKTQPPKNKGGRPATVIPPEILVKATAWLGYEGEPDTLVAIKRKLEALLYAEGRDASDSTLDRWARTIRDAHRDAQQEGS